MFATLLKNIFRTGAQSADEPRAASTQISGEPLRLHIGGTIAHPDWKILNVLPGPDVDYLCHCTDLSAFANDSVQEIYASHVLEHLGYQAELPGALSEFARVLVPGGRLRVSVPDLKILCALFMNDDLPLDARIRVMRMMYGGQLDKADFHYVGLDQTIFAAYLQDAGFAEITRVNAFGLFVDTSCIHVNGQAISLNLEAIKPARTAEPKV